MTAYSRIRGQIFLKLKIGSNIFDLVVKHSDSPFFIYLRILNHQQWVKYADQAHRRVYITVMPIVSFTCQIKAIFYGKLGICWAEDFHFDFKVVNMLYIMVIFSKTYLIIFTTSLLFYIYIYKT